MKEFRLTNVSSTSASNSDFKKKHEKENDRLPPGQYKDLNAFINEKIEQAFKKEKKKKKKQLETKKPELNAFEIFKKLEIKDSDDKSSHLKDPLSETDYRTDYKVKTSEWKIGHEPANNSNNICLVCQIF